MRHSSDPNKRPGSRLFSRRSGKKRRPLRVLLPVLCVAGAAVGGYFLASSCTLCYTVDAQGRSLAFFQEEATYREAVTQAETRASQILNSDYSFDQSLSVRPAVAFKSSIEETPEVADSIMTLIPELEQVYTLSVDGMIVGAAKEAETITQALDMVKSHYTTPNTLSLRLDSQIDIRYQYLPSDTGLYTAEELAGQLLVESPRTFTYTTQTGDTLEDITARFSMTTDRFWEMNPDPAVVVEAPPDLPAAPKDPLAGLIDPPSDLVVDPTVDPNGPSGPAIRRAAVAVELDANGVPIPPPDPAQPTRLILPDGLVLPADLLPSTLLFSADLNENMTLLIPGMDINIEQSCPRLIVSTVEEQSYVREIPPDTQTQLDSSLFSGEQRVIQDGCSGKEAVLSRVVKRCGLTVEENDLRQVVTDEAVPMVVGIGTQPSPQTSNGAPFIWPLRGRITSDYGPRIIFGKTGFHRGIDIAAPMGTAINAAADGTVVFAGVRGTYGNLVIIAHEGGLHTYYGHCSKFLVSPGQVVIQGQPIAAVGSTGRSTGPHCHFEVRFGGSCIDPMLYLPYTNNAPARLPIPLDPQSPLGPNAPLEQPEETPKPAEPKPQKPEIPPLPENPEIPMAPDTPETPQTPEDPALPDTPEIPGPRPDDPQSPELPTPAPPAELPGPPPETTPTLPEPVPVEPPAGSGT